jgi:SAM-dependent methyltransferase
MQDNTQKFTGRADAYAKYRPRYPKEILRFLEREADFDSSKIIADVGSGTGMLSRLFLENGNPVFGVEPNDDMRKQAERELAQFPIFTSIKGTAENTTLRNGSIDLVSAGQALHWFDPERSRIEFSRILRHNGHVCIVYNDRTREEPLMESYEKVIEKAKRVTQYSNLDHHDIESDYVSRFLGNSSHKRFSVPNGQTLDFEGLLGRASSASYWPKDNQEGVAQVKAELRALFDEFQKNNRITLTYNTYVDVGAV